jgi:hypothetical protein
MKNIHILPTNKPSRFQKTKHDNFFLASKIELYTDCIAQHIYITSDEQAKQGDWGYIPFQGGDVKLVGKYFADDWKKIILTTDQDLINDGVQAIDDEFLEWFVKNPSCEEVKINYLYEYPNVKHIGYKIIIPSIGINSLKKQD